MNCLEFRREKLADPRRVLDDALRHAARLHASGCEACAAFALEVDAAELELERALEARVPEGLAERILFGSRTARRSWHAWAVAASVLAAFVVGFHAGVSRQTGDADVYARLAIEHVSMEPESLTSGQSVDAKAFQAIMQTFGGTLKALPGRMVYFECCPEEDGVVWHAVFETQQGLATLILVPGKRLPGPETAATARWSALAEPVRGGYYAIVTGSPAGTAAFEKALRESVVWET